MVLIATLRPPRAIAPELDFGRRVEVRPLSWETDFFGRRLGALSIVGHGSHNRLPDRADALAHELRGALREAELDGYQHLTLHVTADDIPAIWAAERAGLRLMDVAVDLKFTFSSTPLPSRGSRRVRPAELSDAPAMAEMTRGAFGLTRFALDPFFTPEQVDRFYATWATNLFSGLADVVFITELGGEVAGFVSCKLTDDGHGRIPLVATAAKFKRRGVARELIAAALAWFADNRCHVALVKTQAANYPAFALYERAGFTIHQTELSFTTTLN